MNVPFVAVDIGNTVTKVTYWDDLSALARWPKLPNVERFDSAALDLSSFPFASDEQHTWVVSCVRQQTWADLKNWLTASRPNDLCHRLTYADLQIIVDVDFPDKVGTDRLLAATAVNALRVPDQTAIIVNSGTAITIDYLSADGQFRGGAILPGLVMAARAMSIGTDALPDIVELLKPPFPAAIGRSTEAAIRSGLLWGSLGAVEKLIEQILEVDATTSPSTNGPTIFLSGGDGKIVSEHLRFPARYVDDLVLSGIVAHCVPQDNDS